MHYYDHKSLHGLRILNTRPLEQALTLNQAITQAGGIPISLPALTIEPINTTWVDSYSDLSRFDQAIFISANAVKYCLLSLKQAHIIITAIGQASANALRSKQLVVHYIPNQSTSESLLSMAHLQDIANQKILLVKGEGGRTLIEDTLVARGSQVTPLIVYRRTLPSYNQKTIEELWQDDALDIILFTSQQSMHNVFTFFGAAAKSWLCNKPCLVISERLEQLAYLAGMQTVYKSKPETIIDTLIKIHQNTRTYSW